ncbi:MAG: YHS domain-containing protein [Chloroflexi bacterium]|nr:YHS domain-containing protein [Chloroflexota bacterium]
MATAKDPVCGMEVDPRKAAGRMEYQGKPYYFCSQECLKQFKGGPKKYVK